MPIDDYYDPPTDPRAQELAKYLPAGYEDMMSHEVQHRLFSQQGPLIRNFGGVGVISAGNLPQLNYHTQTSHIPERFQYHTATTEDLMAVDRKAVIKANMERLEAELFEIEQYGEDDYEENSILVFDMKFPNNDKVFTYAALKKEKQWFITGIVQGSYMTWSQLVNFWKDKVVSILVATTYDAVYLRETSENRGVLEGEVLDKEYDGPEKVRKD